MSSIFFTSDSHFLHQFMVDKRGFASAEEHDEAITARWNDLVCPDDTVWHLGDVGLGPEGDILARVAALNGHKHLIWGNHDRVFGGKRNAWKHQVRWLEVFESVQAYAVVGLGFGEDVMLSHFPFKGDHTGLDRDTQWRLPDEGRLLLHGHLHCEDRRTAARSVHVGMDAWDLRPVPLADVRHLIAGLGG